MDMLTQCGDFTQAQAQAWLGLDNSVLSAATVLLWHVVKLSHPQTVYVLPTCQRQIWAPFLAATAKSYPIHYEYYPYQLKLSSL